VRRFFTIVAVNLSMGLAGLAFVERNYAQRFEGQAPTVAADSSTGEALYSTKCGICHDAGGMYPGYEALSHHSGQRQPVLSRRTDLTPDFVKLIVRKGIGQMPPLTPTYVDDRELGAITFYLESQR